MASTDTNDDVILIAGVLLSGAVFNKLRNRLISAIEAFELVGG